jgi:hypothetical protein
MAQLNLSAAILALVLSALMALRKSRMSLENALIPSRQAFLLAIASS